jgi:predicted small integral membrane protein
MNEHRCAVCGHINGADAKLCDMCESSLGGPDAVNDAGEQSYTYGEGAYASEPHIHTVPFKVVNDVIGPTLELYRKNFLLVIILVVVATLPEAALSYGVAQLMASTFGGPYVASGAPPTPEQLFASVLPGAVLMWLIMIAGHAFLSASLIHAVLDLRQTGAAAAGESLRRGLKSLPKVFLVSLLYAAAVVVGYLLCIVPGVILGVMFALVVPVAIAERRGPVESFKRSADLTNGYKGLVFLTYFLWVIATAVVGFVINGSFAYGGDKNSLAVALPQAFVTGLLNSSTAVLSVFIYLGLLHERGHGFDTHTVTPSGDASER